MRKILLTVANEYILQAESAQLQAEVFQIVEDDTLARLMVEDNSENWSGI